uniref:Uncharacterized protein n=1 Tax=Ciona intestinalis TaxID=7719 RepID=F6YEQ2_CIOIN
MTGSTASRCVLTSQTSAAFDRAPPTCTPLQDLPQCEPQQRAPDHGSVQCTNTNLIGSVCTFSCGSGYYLSGSINVLICGKLRNSVCIYSVTWSSPAPTCEPITCIPSHTSPTNGQVTCSNGNLVGSECVFTCSPGYAVTGEPVSICNQVNIGTPAGVWSSPPPTCQLYFFTTAITCIPQQIPPTNGAVTCDNSNNLVTIRSNYTDCSNMRCYTELKCNPPQSNPTNGSVSCSDENNVNSECEFACMLGFTMVGEPITDCLMSGGVPAWTNVAPVCGRNIKNVWGYVKGSRCSNPPSAPTNGYRVCSDGNYVGSICDYGCDDLYTRVGSQYSTCVELADGSHSFDNPAPTCERSSCRDVQTLPNGNVSCSDGNFINSVCTYDCNAGNAYALFPTNHSTTTCLNDTTWDLPPPCCARRCPPYALMDFVMILDSSSSVRRRNWRIMKNFGRSIIETFRLAEDAARMAAFRYNRVVDTRSQILFRQHVNDMAGFLASYNAIPYNGGGTLTGQALRHAKDVILARRNGNRPNVKDVVLTITDGRSHDNVANVSRELREMGVLTFVVGVVPGNGKQLDENQLLSIAGSRSNMFLATSGFSGLNSAFSARLSESICTNPCAH